MHQTSMLKFVFFGIPLFRKFHHGGASSGMEVQNTEHSQQAIQQSTVGQNREKHRINSHPIIHCPASKPWQYRLLVNNTNANAILPNIVQLQYNTMQYV